MLKGQCITGTSIEAGGIGLCFSIFIIKVDRSRFCEMRTVVV